MWQIVITKFIRYYKVLQTLSQSATDITKWDVTPHCWIKKSRKMSGVATNIRQVTSESINLWNTELTAGTQNLGNVKRKHELFQGDSFLLMFVLVMNPLTLLLGKTKILYQLKKKRQRINHLLFVDDLKLFSLHEKWSFPWRISSVNVTNCRFGHVYWRNP